MSRLTTIGSLLVGPAMSSPYIIVTLPPYNAKGNGVDLDTDAIAAAIADLSTTKSILFFPGPATYLIDGAGFVLPSDVTVFIAPGATIKVKDANNTATVIFSSGPIAGVGSISNVEITGGGCIDGNRANQSSGKQYGIHLRGHNLRVHGIEIKNIYDPTLAYGDAIVVQSLDEEDTRDVRIYDFYLHDNDRMGIAVVGGVNWSISNGQIENSGFMGIDIENEWTPNAIRAGQISDVTITDSYSFGLGLVDNWGAGLSDIEITNVKINGTTDIAAPNGDGLLIRGGNNIRVNGAFISNTVRAGVRIWRSEQYPTPTFDIQLLNVTVDNTGPDKPAEVFAHGIHIFGADGYELQRIKIINARITNAGTEAEEMGIRAVYSDSVIIKDCMVNGSADSGISVDHCDRVEIIGNMSYGNGVEVTAPGVIARDCTHLTIGRITAFDDSGGVQNYGIAIYSCSQINWLGGNNLAGNAINPFYTDDLSTSWFPEIKQVPEYGKFGGSTVSGDITPDSFTGNILHYTLTANAVMKPVANSFTGQRLTFIFYQSGVGGYTVTWDAIYKTIWHNDSVAPNTYSTISFIFNGTLWIQDGAQYPASNTLNTTFNALGGVGGDVSNPAIRILNNRLMVWLDALGLLTNCGFVFLDDNNNLYLGARNASKLRLSALGVEAIAVLRTNAGQYVPNGQVIYFLDGANGLANSGFIYLDGTDLCIGAGASTRIKITAAGVISLWSSAANAWLELPASALVGVTQMTTAIGEEATERSTQDGLLGESISAINGAISDIQGEIADIWEAIEGYHPPPP